MPQKPPKRDTMLCIAEELDAALTRSLVSLPQVRRLARALVAAAEQEAWRLKVIAEIANHGTPTRDTLRWARQLAAVTEGADTPPAA